MPREIVFRLNGGGDVTPVGGVDWPLPTVVVVPPPVAGVVPVVSRRSGGETSGEKMLPSAYSDRFSPYFFARGRFTSRISTSTTISARGLSFCEMIFSRICTTAVRADRDRVGRLVRDDRRLNRDARQAMIVLSSCASSVGSALRQVERPDDLLVVLRVLLGAVSGTRRSSGRSSTLYDSWSTLRIWLSACRA